MQISTSMMTQQGIASMTSLESQINQTQQEISTGQSMQTAADNPAAWAQTMDLNQVLAANGAYQTNVSTATQRLNLETGTLNNVTGTLSSLNQLAIQANSGTLNTQDRQNIAGQMQQLYNQLLSYANTQGSDGLYIFGGTATGSAPFSQTSGGVVYNGNQGQRQISIGQNQSVADGDSGSSVFMNAASGNGTFAVTANSANTGTAQITATNTIDPSLWNGGSYNLSFNGGNYQVTDSGGNVVSSGAYTAGNGIRFGGIEVTFSGTPANGDSFSITPSQPTSVFATIQNLITTIGSSQATPAQIAQAQTAMYGAQQSLNNAFNQVNTVNASVGSRLSALTSAGNDLTQQSTSIQQAQSTLQSTDLAQAASQLSLQTTVLQAVQLAFSKVQGLSLFNYIH